MKITKLEITGMNKIVNKSYDLSDATYITGDNGAGKSTILQAIQLGLLGYIPGLAKKNADIFQHCNNGMFMGVKLVFDTEDHIQRNWNKSGKSVQSSVDSSLSAEEIAELTSSIEIPVYNFNQFLSLSSNAQKDWLLQFLTSNTTKIDWQTELMSNLPANIQPSEKLLSTVLSLCTDDVKTTNTNIKQQLSIYKQMANNLSGGIQSLVCYDNIDTSISESEVVVKLNDLKHQQSLYTNIINFNNQAHNLTANIHNMKTELSEIDHDELDASLSCLGKKLNELQAAKVQLHAELIQVNKDISDMSGPSSDVCPVLHIHCDKLEQNVADSETLLSEYTSRRNGIQAELDRVASEIETITTRHNEVNMDMSRYIHMTNELAKMETELDKLQSNRPEGCDTLPDIEYINSEIDRYTDILVKIRANNEYNKKIDSFTQQLAQVEQDIAVLKEWDKLTGPNGIQYKLIADNVDKFNALLSSHVAEIWGPDYSCKFVMSGIANSFKMGVTHNDMFLSYDVLSSGEKCLFMLAFMVAVTASSSCPLKIIMIDDALDHLDDKHIVNVFKQCSSIPDIQIVLAGVKSCANEDISIINL